MDIRDKAMALAAYAKQALNCVAERKAAEIRLRAEIRAGELLKAMRQNGERRAGKSKNGELESNLPILKPTLSDLGVSADQSFQCAETRRYSREKREAYIAEPDHIPTAKALLDRHGKTEPVEAEPALSDLGILKDQSSQWRRRIIGFQSLLTRFLVSPG